MYIKHVFPVIITRMHNRVWCILYIYIGILVYYIVLVK